MGKVDRTSFLTIKMSKIIECRSQIVVDSHVPSSIGDLQKKKTKLTYPQKTECCNTTFVCVCYAINASLPIYYVIYAPCARASQNFKYVGL